MTKALFLVGAPGSGKDFLLRALPPLKEVTEIPLDKLAQAIEEQTDIDDIDGRNIIVNGVAERYQEIKSCKSVLEAIGYKTGMVYVYTTNEASKARNDFRIARQQKTFSEAARAEKYQAALGAMQNFSMEFKPFWLFNNSANEINEEVQTWLAELDSEISTFFEDQKFKSMAHYNHVKHPPQVPATSVEHKSTIKGYERVKKDGRWVLRPKTQSEEHKYSSLNRAFETYTATAVDNSRGNSNIVPSNSPTENPATVMSKVLKPRKTTPPGDQQSGIAYSRAVAPPVWETTGVPIRPKKNNNKGTKGAKAPPNYLDSKVGMVPSGSMGITSDYRPQGKSLSEIRGKK